MKNINQLMKSYIQSFPKRKNPDEILPGETQVEFEGKGKNLKIKSIKKYQPKKREDTTKGYYV